MFYEVAKGHGLARDPFRALVAPRPIGWITTLGPNGEVNLSPYSFFNAVSEQPHLVAFSSQGAKDAMTFAEATGEFVCNFVSFDQREAMNLSSTPLPRGESEMAAFGIAAAPSVVVKPPRVADAPAALECAWLKTVPLEGLGGQPAGYHLVIGQVLAVHVQDAFMKDGQVDTGAMRPIMRGGYADEYFAIGPENLFNMTRPRGGGSKFD